MVSDKKDQEKDSADWSRDRAQESGEKHERSVDIEKMQRPEPWPEPPDDGSEKDR